MHLQSSSESLGGIFPTLESSSSSLRSYVFLVNSLGLDVQILSVYPQRLSKECLLIKDIPVRLLSPRFLIPNYIHNLPIGAGITRTFRVSLSQDISAALYPYCVSEALRKLQQYRLLVGQFAGIQVVSFGLDDADERLARFEIVRGCQCLLGSCEDIALGFAHGCWCW